MDFFASTFTDWIVALTSVGIAGAACKVALEELPKWRHQRDVEAWDRDAREIVRRVSDFKIEVSEALGTAESEFLECYSRLKGVDAKPPFKLISAQERGARVDDSFLALMSAIEVGVLIWPGELEEAVGQVAVAHRAYLQELHELIAATESEDIEILDGIWKRISGQPAMGAAQIQVSPVLACLLGAASVIQHAVGPRLFGGTGERP